jgi:PAS domain S-box-containing protein
MGERLPVYVEGCFVSRWYENYVYPTKEGLSVYWREITDRKRAEAALRRSEAYLAEGQKISHTGSWAWNVSTGELFWSVEHFRIFGLDPENFTPTIETARQLIHPEDAPAAIRAFDGAIRERNDFQWDFRIVRPDGTIRYVRSLGHPAFNESGDLIEYVGTIMDTTERKRAEEELRKTEAELTHVTRLTTMGELAASIAHEINQPLGAIVNNGNVAMRLATAENGSLDKLVEVLSDVVSDANRTSAIIARIRSVMRKSAPEKTSLQLKDLVADVLALAQRELAERRIEVRTELPEDLPRVSGDRVQLHQVLLNLVMNAIDAMDGMEERRHILKIEGRTYEMAGDPAVLITVQDLGCGFKPEDSERLFEPFYTTKTGRMGMGLRISRSIVEAHGGHLWATSNDGEGATFHFALPVGERDET